MEAVATTDLEAVLAGPTTISRKARMILKDYGVRYAALPLIELPLDFAARWRPDAQATLTVAPCRIDWPDRFDYFIHPSGKLLYITIDATPGHEVVLFVTLNSGQAWQYTDVAEAPF